MNQSNWYVARDGNAHGPISPDGVRELLAKGEINAGTLIWRHPMSDWKPLREVPEIAMQAPPPVPTEPSPPNQSTEQLREPPALGPTDVASGEAPGSAGQTSTMEPPEEPSSDGTHPWRRFFARTADYTVFGILFGFVLLLILPPVAPGLFDTLFVEDGNDFAFTFVMMLSWIPVEGWALSNWGTTPGKWLLSLRVLRKSGDYLSFGVGVKRALHVWVRGLGLGIPLIALITQLVAVNKLQKKGETTWDRDLGLAVAARDLKAGRIVLLLATLGVTFYLIYLGSVPAT